MNNKRTRRLVLLSFIAFIFLYKSSFIAEDFKFKNRTCKETENWIIISSGDNYAPLISKSSRKSPIHRNNSFPFGFGGFNSSIYIEIFATACLLLSSILSDIRKRIMELIPAHFYGSKYDFDSIFS